MSDGLTDKRGQDHPPIGSFGNKDDLLLQRAGNGGWTVISRPDRAGMQGETIGAYTNTKDMIDALSSALQ